MAEHRALGAPRGAAGVEQRREVARQFASYVVVRRGPPSGLLDEGGEGDPRAVHVDRVVPYQQRRLRVGEQAADLPVGVRRVQGQVHRAGAGARDVQRDDVRGLPVCTATRSPGRTPRPVSWCASRADAASRSPYVHRSPRRRAAAVGRGRCGRRAAAAPPAGYDFGPPTRPRPGRRHLRGGGRRRIGHPLSLSRPPLPGEGSGGREPVVRQCRLGDSMSFE